MNVKEREWMWKEVQEKDGNNVKEGKGGRECKGKCRELKECEGKKWTILNLHTHCN